ncbi:MAG TPA: family 1 glycosylhydrolase [Collinsella ihuae]|uniref:Family 1 glycosylhydrolase n=1 Tax=Collinsella ihumii TaxID=1720204 RepID=A0A921IPX5_9ACTN|nr:family 1 glycosylhydrolase [Collinsella ihumii]
MAFPKGFLIGAATAAHQVEGDNMASDFWLMEQMEHTSYAEPSLAAIDHYHRFAGDIELLANAGLNAFRFSIEWARIEPEPGKFSAEALNHYRAVIDCCRVRGVEPIVTLFHFSSPAWLIRQGGWEAPETVASFARYVRYVAEGLGDRLHYVFTINEANLGAQIAGYIKLAANGDADGTNIQMGLNLEGRDAEAAAMEAEYRELFGTPSPASFNTPRTDQGNRVIMDAHRAACAVLRDVCPHAVVGLTLSLHDLQPVTGGEAAAAEQWHTEFGQFMPAIADDDILGIQSYTRAFVGPEGMLPTAPDAHVTQMGYEYYPEAAGHLVRRIASEFNGKIMMTENGVGTADDAERCTFIERVMADLEECVSDGVPLVGYCHWSLLDNFEWESGYRMQFGLVAVDRTTMERLPRPSLELLGSYAKRIGA